MTTRRAARTAAEHELEEVLPQLHDASLDELHIDYPHRVLHAFLRLYDESEPRGSPVDLVVEDLVYCAIEPPEIDIARGYVPTPDDGLWIDAGHGPVRSRSHLALPPAQDDTVSFWIFAQNWNGYLHIRGGRVSIKPR